MITTDVPLEISVGPGEKDNGYFGIAMRSYRVKAGLSRVQAANAIGISVEFLRLIEKGTRTPAAGTAKLMLDAYGVQFEVRPVDDKYMLVYDQHRVTFTSRIQEARHKLGDTYNAGRNELIGQIVYLLVKADDDTLEQIREILTGD